MHTVFVNPERCIGCCQCAFACAVAHSKSGEATGAVLEDPPPRPRIHVESGGGERAFPNRCRHCDPAPCRTVCPTGALERDAASGLVLVNHRRCIACAMCGMVCPFSATTWHVDPKLGRAVATKCDGCRERMEGGGMPACAEACKSGALVFGEINDLVREGRLRYAGQALAAASQLPPLAAQAGPVDSWRAVCRVMSQI